MRILNYAQAIREAHAQILSEDPRAFGQSGGGQVPVEVVVERQRVGDALSHKVARDRHAEPRAMDEHQRARRRQLPQQKRGAVVPRARRLVVPHHRGERLVPALEVVLLVDQRLAPADGGHLDFGDPGHPADLPPGRGAH